VTGSPSMPLLAALAFLLGLALLGPAPAAAQLFRVVDETGTVHYTNRPCDPRYVRLLPGACPPPAPSPESAAAPTAGNGTASTAPGPGALPVGSALAREIESAATRHGLDRRLVEAVVRVESGGNPRAVSPRGALGVMQLMPSRAEALGVTDVFDVRANLEGGVRHLRDLLARYRGDLPLALAAYNAGEEAVRLHRGVPPYRETQEYVQKVLSLYAPAASPAGRAPAKPPARPAARPKP
jgi:hypothetical protein